MQSNGTINGMQYMYVTERIPYLQMNSTTLIAYKGNETVMFSYAGNKSIPKANLTTVISTDLP